MKTLIEQATELSGIPKTWPYQREEATERLLVRMAQRIEELEGLVRHVCPDKSADI